MRLTQKQEWILARYLRAVGDELGDVPDTLREQALSRVKARIKRELKAFTTSPLRDPQVQGVLQRLGPPAQQAVEQIATQDDTPLLVLSMSERILLGVCGGIAEYLEVEPTQIRFVAMVLGLLTGPLALVAYLALYFEMYNATRHTELCERLDKIDWVQVLRISGGTLLAVLSLQLAASITLILLGAISSRLAVDGTSSLGAWQWLREHLSEVMHFAMSVLGPVAILTGLPVSGQWQQRGKWTIYIVLALYAVVLCFGLALNIVGVLLQWVARVSLAS